MKFNRKIIITTLLVEIMLLATNLQAQENPLKKYGFDVKVMTLSNGKYKEFLDEDSLVQIGSVIINVNKDMIVSFVEHDTIYSEATLKPEIMSRWFAPDPLGEKYPTQSPYSYVGNNPIYFIDPTGEELQVHFYGKGSNTKFINEINKMFNGQFKLTFTQVKDENGEAINGQYKVGIKATKDGGDISKLSKGAQSFYKSFSQVVNSKIATVKLDVFNGSENVNTGNYEENAIDMADMEQWPEFNHSKDEQEGATRGGKIIHELREQYNKALDGFEKGDWKNKRTNHNKAISFENRINGNTRLPDSGSMNSPSGVIQNFKQKNGTVVKFSVTGFGKKVLIIKRHN